MSKNRNLKWVFSKKNIKWFIVGVFIPIFVIILNNWLNDSNVKLETIKRLQLINNSTNKNGEINLYLFNNGQEEILIKKIKITKLRDYETFVKGKLNPSAKYFLNQLDSLSVGQSEEIELAFVVKSKSHEYLIVNPNTYYIYDLRFELLYNQNDTLKFEITTWNNE